MNTIPIDMMRMELTPKQVAHHLQRCLDKGVSKTDLGILLNQSEDWVDEQLKLFDDEYSTILSSLTLACDEYPPSTLSSPKELAKHLRMMMKRGKTKEQISVAIDWPIEKIDSYLALLEQHEHIS